MKATLYKNIDLVTIPIKAGVSEYYLPQNVSWAKCKVDKIVICTPTSASCLSPVDGKTPVVQSKALQNMYVNIYTDEDKELMYDAHSDVFVHTNNYPIYIHAALNLSLCRIYFTAEPTADGCLLLYVFYDSKTTETYTPPTQSITVSFPLAGDEKLTLQNIINTYIHALPSTVRAITCWDAGENPAYLTLRDHALSYIVRDLHTELCRPQMVGETAETTQAFPFLTDNMDVDFDYSFIQNATNKDNKQTITFHF